MNERSERAQIEHTAALVRAEFAAARERGVREAQALQDVAIMLEFSLEDCAAAVGRVDLLARPGPEWVLGPSAPPGRELWEIRPCAEAELDVLTARWPVPGGVHEAHHARQLRGRATYLVAWRGETPLGSVVLRRDGYNGERGSVAYPEAVEICHLQVRPEHRGQGVGTALIAGAEREALRHGHRVVAMGADDDNPGALRLYERLGYRVTGIVDITEYDWVDEDGAVHHAREHDQLLVKRLTSC